jgi:hypothetical protein
LNQLLTQVIQRKRSKFKSEGDDFAQVKLRKRWKFKGDDFARVNQRKRSKFEGFKQNSQLGNCASSRACGLRA